ncbi:hypothetical protein TEQG_08698 [Trichophyton equinum CBS 127.97]|uniref:Serine protease n=1 Tax=Trichophyton equinum (strain ATCC MYA-4606 / CBS 127.97) TaxID=559882 RepID=F2PUL4_TRIEC|nr:hypothetical protein TEQG_08698 [Trichophyton equinum CBS 127.97]
MPANMGGSAGSSAPSYFLAFITSYYGKDSVTKASFIKSNTIRVPNSTSTSRGFGFSLKLAEESLRDKSLQICGFPTDWTRPEPSTSSGDCKRWIRCHLEYQIATAKGLSGAPVFMPFKGHDTVIGIHTNGSDLRRGNSKGCWLTETVLEQVFRWLGAYYEDKALRVSPSNNAPPEVYIFAFLRSANMVGRWERRAETTLNISLLRTHIKLTGKPTYVFRFRHRTDGLNPEGSSDGSSGIS